MSIDPILRVTIGLEICARMQSRIFPKEQRNVATQHNPVVPAGLREANMASGIYAYGIPACCCIGSTSDMARLNFWGKHSQRSVSVWPQRSFAC
jgi:hypothetical protein